MQAFNPFSLAGKRVFITGASSGLGWASALACARMGAEVIGTGRDEARLQQLLTELQAISALAHQVVAADVTLTADRERLVDQISAPVHGVLHSAGASRLSPVRMVTEEHLNLLQQLNVNAPVLLTRALLKKNLVRPGGAILFISSIAAHIGVPGVAIYSGTKAALIAIMRCLAMEVTKHKIRVNALCPALVETRLLEQTAQVTGAASMDEERSHYPLGFGKPDDVANAVIFFLSDASRWITGTDLIMDGGLTIT